MKEFFSFLLEAGKAILSSKIFWTLVVILVVYLIIRPYLKTILGNKDDRKEIKGLDTDIQNMVNNGVKASYSENWYIEQANKVEKAFKNGAADPTDEPALYTIFSQLKNNLDIALLKKYFGIRRYVPQNWFGGSEEDVTLPQYMVISLSPGERSKINTILKTNGVNNVF